MKKLSLIILTILAVSCNKKPTEEADKKAMDDTLRKIDSINAYRTKYNDSIRTLNSKNQYKDLSGNHKLTHSEVSQSGSVKFTKKGRDEYEISGGIKSGNSSLEINGIGELVTEKYINFDGKITQKINGKTFVRTEKTSFKNEGNGNFWRLQNKLNGDGFVEYIDIYK